MTGRARALRSIALAIFIGVPILLLVLPHFMPGRTQLAVWPIDPASPTAVNLDRVWTIVLYVGTGVTILIGGLMVYAIMTFGKPGPITDEEPPQIHGNVRLEITWTFIPIVIVTVLLAVAVSTLQATAPPRVDPKGTIYVDIVGYQWAWGYTFPQLPGLKTGFNGVDVDLHLPVRHNTEWRVTSTDVVHDWFVPALEGHMDAYPTHIVRNLVYPSREGTYYAQCSKFCGLYHWKMHNNVIVESPALFAQWALKNGAKRADLARLFPGDTSVATALLPRHGV